LTHKLRSVILALAVTGQLIFPLLFHNVGFAAREGVSGGQILLCATQNNTEVSFSGVIPNIPICNDTSKKVLHLMGLESFESGITNRATFIDRKGGSRRRGNRHPLPQMLFENQSVWLIRRDHGNVDAINLSRSLARVRQVNRDAEMLRGIRDIKMDSLYPNPSSLVDFETPSGLIQAAYQPEDAKNGSYGRYSGDPIEAICREQPRSSMENRMASYCRRKRRHPSLRGLFACPLHFPSEQSMKRKYRHPFQHGNTLTLAMEDAHRES
jgi:hypothetical protein